MSEGREQVRVNGVGGLTNCSGLGGRRRGRSRPDPPLRSVRVGVGEEGGVAEVHRRVQVHVRTGRNLVAGQNLENDVSQVIKFDKNCAKE